MKIYLYDFDDTIYDGDSTVDFYKFSLKRQKALILYLPIQVLYLILYKMRIVKKKKFKSKFFSFLNSIKDIDSLILDFWNINEKKIKSFYVNKNHENDVIISASPEFLLQPMVDKLKVKNLIATRVNIQTGDFESENCYGLEKVLRLEEIFPSSDYSYEEMYTDSLSDEPLLKISKKGFIVKGDLISEYNPVILEKKSLFSKICSIFLTQKFFTFLVVGLVNALNGILFAYLFSSVFNYIVAFILGYALSLTISYLLNSIFTFKDLKFTINKYIKFCISYIPNFLVQVISVFIFVDLLKLDKIYAYLFAVILGIPITFILLSVYAFSNKKK